MKLNCKILVALVISTIVVLFSCDRNSLVDTEVHKSDFKNCIAREFVALDFGTLHNEVLSSFNAKHSFNSCGTLRVKEYVRTLVEVTNEAFRENGMESRVTEIDVVTLLQNCKEMRDQGIADVFQVPSDIPYSLFAYMVEREYMTEADAQVYISVLRDIPSSSRCVGGKNIIDENVFARSTCDPERDARFNSIARNSYAFWNSIHSNMTKNTLESVEDTTNTDPWWPEEKMNDFMLMYWDSTWGLVGGTIGSLPGAFLGTVIGSTAFLIWGDDMMGDLYDMFNIF